MNMYFIGIFFFKQKTAYEMRISDWSSDVCSSDLSQKLEVCRLCPKGNRAGATRCHIAGDRQGAGALVSYSGRIAGGDRPVAVGAVPVTNIDDRIGILAGLLKVDGTVDHGRRRSEEHTSELQSLMRISYAVF